MRIVEWWRRRRYAAGRAAVLTQFCVAMGDPTIGEVTIHCYEGRGAYIEGWNSAVNELALTAIRDMTGHDGVSDDD